MRRLFFVLIAWLCLAGSAWASTLSTTIAAMPADSWAVISPSNTGVIGGGLTTSFGDSGAWDPINRKFLFTGADHGVGYDFVIWDDATNAWTSGAALPGVPKSTIFVGHAFDGNTTDYNGNYFYRCRRGTCGNDIYKYNVTTGAWTTLPNNTAETNENNDCCTGIAYFPELGGLVWITNTGQIWLWNATSNTWSLLTTASGYSAGTWAFAEYNPIRKVVLFGSGVSSQLFSLSATGVVTAKGAIPHTIYSGDGFNGHVTHDPVTGLFIVLTSGTHQCKTYEVSTDTWGTCTNPPAGMQNMSVASASVTNYGATVYFNCGQFTGSCTGNMYIYKRASLTADSDFATRCATAGVTACWGFNNTTTDIVTTGANPNLYAGDTTTASLDTVTKVSGAGSLRFNLPAGASGANIAGQWTKLNSPYNLLGASFGGGQTFYLQFQQRFNPAMMTNTSFWNSSWKQVAFYQNNVACAAMELTTVHKNFSSFPNNFPVMYTDCGDPGQFNPTNGGFIYLQQGADPFPTGAGYNCRFGFINGTECFIYPTDKWITFYYKITIGTYSAGPNDFVGTQVDAWVAIDGGPYKQWQNITMNLSAGGNGASAVINNITFLPYMTSLSTSAPLDAFTWIDELIVSTLPISAPQGAGSGGVDPPIPPAPTNPVSFRISQLSK
jgi:hypothetical protein